ncbi:MAG: hypothetical protein U1U88_001280 [Lawsonella clevelandensis]
MPPARPAQVAQPSPSPRRSSRLARHIPRSDHSLRGSRGGHVTHLGAGTRPHATYPLCGLGRFLRRPLRPTPHRHSPAETCPRPGPSTFWARLLCLNSARNYPRLAAVESGAELRDVSCSSATTDNFRDPQYPGVPPQRDGLRPDTELVTVTLGANDTKIAYLIWGCPLGFVYAPSQQEGCAKLAQRMCSSG